MKAYWGSGFIAPRIFDLGTRWRWVVSFTPQSLYPQRKSFWYPLERRLGGPQCRSGGGGKEKNSQPLSTLEPPCLSQNSWLPSEILKIKIPSYNFAIFIWVWNLLFGNRVMGRIFGPKREEVTRVWRKLLSEVFHNLCFFSIIIRMNNSRTMMSMEYASRMEVWNAYKILVGKPEGKIPLERFLLR
jgi:hypothetical protein